MLFDPAHLEPHGGIWDARTPGVDAPCGCHARAPPCDCDWPYCSPHAQNPQTAEQRGDTHCTETHTSRTHDSRSSPTTSSAEQPGPKT